MDAYSLYQVNEYIKRSIAINFPTAIWIQAEIGQIRQARGHWFIELVEKGEKADDIVAQASAVIWAPKYLQIKKKVGADLNAVLADGMEVMLKCQVNFHERYGLKFAVEDVQAEYTLGKLAKDRAATIAELRRLKLIGGNTKVEAAPVLQRLAIISSASAAGYQDFVQQLKDNKYGYRFFIDLYPAAMQGMRLEPEILEALSQIAAADKYDAVVIIRGGGSRLDLMGFDSLLLSKAIALFPLPVLTGIGHDIDEAVIDLIAYRALKTPTAVAEYLVHYNVHFEEDLLEQIQWIYSEAANCLQKEKEQLLRHEAFFKIKVPALLSNAQHQLQLQLSSIEHGSQRLLSNSALHLDKLSAVIDLLSPDKILQRGFSINLINGKAVSAQNLPVPGAMMTSITRVGKVISKIEQHEPN